MRKPYLERVREGVLLFDGAMGTLLYQKGIFLNQCFEKLSLSRPELIREIHQEYIQAGAEVIETNTYGANARRLLAFGLDNELEEINTRAVELAREVAGSEIYVAGSVGPLGGYLEPLGTISRESAREMYRRQFCSLLAGEVDLILLETFRNLDELLLAVNLCRELAPEIPIQAQFTVDAQAQGELGISARQIAAALDKNPAVDILGFNCSVGPADSLEILQTLRKLTAKPIAVMPNAGYPKEVDGRLIYLSSPDYFASYSRRFIEAGVNIIGGCCGTTPAHIREISRGIGTRTIRAKTELIPVQLEVTEQAEVPLAERSHLGNLLERKRWITLVELVPPLGTSLNSIIAKAGALKRYGITAINLPDGPRASARISGMISAVGIEQGGKIETLIHYCCRDRNLIGMQSDILGAHAIGLRNILIVTGDPPKLGGYPNATGVFDVDSVGLTKLVARMNRGIDFGGNALEAPTSFVIGVGANPEALSLELEVEKTFRKKEAGAQFIITQPVFDVKALRRFLELIRPTGLPVIAGAWPLASYKNALFLQNEVPEVNIPPDIMERMQQAASKEEALATGIRITKELILQVKDQLAGVQVSPPFGRIATALTLIEELHS